MCVCVFMLSSHSIQFSGSSSFRVLTKVTTLHCTVRRVKIYLHPLFEQRNEGRSKEQRTRREGGELRNVLTFNFVCFPNTALFIVYVQPYT
jgi:hypothetical protein